MSADSSRAVFLSYASQDADAARRICETLRASGVEVWFDADGGLEHGDEWDAKIRKQIKECVLFIPIISAHTQARPEGYFRIEWALAAERAVAIADGVPFILPIVIDATPEADALVPDRFRKVQWMRLPAGVVTPPAQRRMQKLWLHRTGALRTDGDHGPGGNQEPDRRDQGAQSKDQRPRTSWLVAAVAVVFGVIGWWVMQSRRTAEQSSGGSVATTQVVASNPKADSPAATEAQGLIVRAWHHLNSPELARAQLDAADELCRRAAALDSTNPEVWAAWSHVDTWYVYHHLGAVDERRQSAQAKATRALQLSANGFEPRLAQACFLVRGQYHLAPSLYAVEAERILNELLKERSGEPRVLLALGILLRNLKRLEEGREAFAQAAGSPAFAAQAWNEAGWLDAPVNPRAAEEAAERSIGVHPFWANLSLKVWLALYWHGDVARAKSAFDLLPLAARQEDWGVAVAATVFWLHREPAEMLRVLEAAPRDWLYSNWYSGPKAYLAGLAYRMDGKPEAARIQWEAALKNAEQQLETKPNEPTLLHWKGNLLGLLGRRDEAARFVKLAHDLGVRCFAPDEAWDRLVLGEPDAAIAVLEEAVAKPPSWYTVTAARLRLDPRYEAVRTHSRFQALLRKAEADPRLAPMAPRPEIRGQKSGQRPDLAPAKSVAVLAFENLSDDRSNEYFSDGISEELLNVLAKVPGLRVAARTSAFHFKGKNATAQEIGEKLGVTHLVEGSVRKAGAKMRIAARLSKAATGEQLWSESYEKEWKDIFTVQDEIATTVVGKVRGVLLGGAAADVTKAIRGRTANVEAHALFLEARQLGRSVARAELERAVALCKQALALDPDFALAWAELSTTTRNLSSFFGVPDFDEGYALAREAARRALVLEPGLVEAHAAMASVRSGYDFDWAGARRDIDRALALAPNDVGSLLAAAWLSLATGRINDGIAQAQRCLELDPISADARLLLGYLYIAANRFAEAISEWQQLVPVNPVFGYSGWASVLLLQGRPDEALAKATQVADDTFRLFLVAMIQHARQQRAESDAQLKLAGEKFGKVIAYQMAEAHAFRAEPDEAFAWLQRAHRQRDPGLQFIKTDPYLRRLHRDPRWMAFLRKLGLADEQLK